MIISSTAVMISAIPALSSAPRRVVPSVVINVRPLKSARYGNSFTERTLPLVPNTTSFPS